MDKDIIKCGRDEFVLACLHVYIFLVCAICVNFIPLLWVLIAVVVNFLVYASSSIILRRSGLIHLDIVFLGFLLIYSLSVPISFSILPERYNSDTMIDSVRIALLGYFGFSVGALAVTGSHRKIAPLNNLDEGALARFRIGGIVVFWLGVLSSVLAIALTSGFSAYLSAGYAGRALLKRDLGPIEIGLYVCVVGLFAVAASVLLSKRSTRASKFIIIFSFIFFFLYVSFLGIRRPVFLLSLGLLAGYSIVRHKPRLLSSLVFIVPAFLFFTTFAQYRQIISSNGMQDTLNFVSANLSWEWLDVSETELGAPFRTLYDYLSYYGNQMEFRFGRSYFDTFLYIFPSLIIDSVVSLSVEYTNTFFSSEFISIGGNMGFFPVTEAYLNFGQFGVVVVFIVFGTILSHLNRMFHERGRSDVGRLVLFMILVPWCAFFMRLDMASFFKGFFYSQLLPLFLVIFLSRIIKVRRVRR